MKLLFSPKVSSGASSTKTSFHETHRVLISPRLMPDRRPSKASLLWVPFFLAALGLLLTSCQTPSEPQSASAIPAEAMVGTTNVLHEGDLIQVTFEGSTNLNTSLRIPFDGIIAMAYVGKVKAAGKTIQALETELGGLYENQIKTSQITVSVLSAAAAVYVGGAVLKPGKIPLDRPLTLLDAIIEAGGVDQARAKISEVTVLRVEGGKRVPYRVNLKRLLQGTDPDLFYLRPADVIYIPTRIFNF